MDTHSTQPVRSGLQTVAELAREIRTSRRFIYEEIRLGRLKVIRVPGGYRILNTDKKRWMERLRLN